MYKINFTGKYKKDLKRIDYKKYSITDLEKVVQLLSTNEAPLPAEYKDHSLKGKYKGCRECHIKPDWLLVYKKNKNELILLLLRTGSHSELF